ncbi:hypothetical protein TanjilG_22429 [Lupinus angustifolius]|uniref:Uncharacterized protein n=1 Tax=Lupinus angustifolius TaxID=3871 RepID=A0A4P1RS45_LUPAN|nr:hypothetical protein TanjilG_22429 [Lupinus angustifolius]
MMKFKPFSTLLLGCLMFMSTQVLGDSSSRVVQGKIIICNIIYLLIINRLILHDLIPTTLSAVDQEGNKNKLEVTTITSMYAPKEPFERTEATHMRKLGPGGKKLNKHEDTSIDSTSKSDKGVYGEGSSMISGKKKDASQKSLGSLRDQRNDIQEHMKMRPKLWKFTRFAIRRSDLTNTNTKYSKDSNAVTVKVSLKSPSKSEEPKGTTQKDETPSIAEEAKEIASLMYKDYKGKPSHKPPINNNEPRN